MFGFLPLTALEMAAAVAIVAAYVATTDAARAWFFRSVNAREPWRQIVA